MRRVALFSLLLFLPACGERVSSCTDSNQALSASISLERGGGAAGYSELFLELTRYGHGSATLHLPIETCLSGGVLINEMAETISFECVIADRVLPSDLQKLDLALSDGSMNSNPGAGIRFDWDMHDHISCRLSQGT